MFYCQTSLPFLKQKSLSHRCCIDGTAFIGTNGSICSQVFLLPPSCMVSSYKKIIPRCAHAAQNKRERVSSGGKDSLQLVGKRAKETSKRVGSTSRPRTVSAVDFKTVQTTCFANNVIKYVSHLQVDDSYHECLSIPKSDYSRVNNKKDVLNGGSLPLSHIPPSSPDNSQFGRKR